jgi:hypothetical protein
MKSCRSLIGSVIINSPSSYNLLLQLIKNEIKSEGAVNRYAIPRYNRLCRYNTHLFDPKHLLTIWGEYYSQAVRKVTFTSVAVNYGCSK